MRKVTALIVHHSASPRATTTAALIKRWHLGKGYKTIGYHHVIEGDGKYVVGRSIAEAGAHAYRHNWYTEGVCVVGNFETEEPTEAQVRQLVQVLAARCRAHGLTAAVIFGHRDINATACPGKNLYARLPEIRARVAAYLKPAA